MLEHYNLKLPDKVAVFRVPEAGVRRWDASALVYDVASGTGSGFATGFLRHYSFFDRWFAVNVSFDGEGQLAAEATSDGWRWAFNCDVATPMTVVAPGKVARVDLELDVLAAPDGRDHRVKDEDDFARSVAAGWIAPGEAAEARRGLQDLLEIIAGGGLVAFCREVCPFPRAGDLRALPAQPPVLFPPRAEAPFFADRRK